MKLTQSIANALSQAIEGRKNRYRLSLEVGIPQQTLKRWAELSAESINDDAFGLLLPYLAPYLPAEEYASYCKIYGKGGDKIAFENRPTVITADQINRAANSLGVTNTTIYDWLRGRVESINPDQMERLRPMILHYLTSQPDKEESTTMTKTEITEIVEAVVVALEKKAAKTEPAAVKVPASRKTQEQRDCELVDFILREVRTSGQIGKAELLYRSHARNRDFSRAVNMLAERGAIKLSAQILQIGR